ncbi:hypothetical protein DFQ27_002786 [Actinomortierella ambigua]|uniref:FAD-binding PCMH-type domain-containing protein n=1 Tax=Actinomortierella ambigua TaxID=1343610 RepID=A0A9P6Q8F5_9FUNG|nr:hypothetical protein DFQ27_002786 [Actinomortierella ambigua]
MHYSLSSPILAALIGAVLFAGTPATGAPEDAEFLNAAPSSLRCKCQPHQSCWPSASAWSAFNSTVGGSLIATTPASRECHQPYFDQAKCDKIKEGYSREEWRQHQPGAVIQANWETFRGKGCLLNQKGPCHQGAVPVFTVKASSVADVQATVRFASQHNIRLVVKNTGHCFLGRSTAVSSLNLWTFFMKKIQVTDKFVPEGAPAGTKGTDAIILEAGVQWKDANKAVDAKNRIVVGGAQPNVGTSGAFCQSGGYGPLSPRHGLCVDNVLQYKVVTTDGQLVTANAHQYQDLFWALRGGGPSFGVVVEAVYRTHPALKNVNLAMASVQAPDANTMDRVVQAFYSQQPRLSKDGWVGYTTIRSTGLTLAYNLDNASEAQAKDSFQLFLDAMKSTGNVTITNQSLTQFPTYLGFRDAMSSLTPFNAGLNFILGSRLIPGKLLETQQGPSQLAKAMRQVLDETTGFANEYLSMLVAGGEVAKGNSQDTSVHPAWRQSLMFNIVYGSWLDDTPYADQQYVQQTMTRAIDHLRRLIPGFGTYLNEADPNEPNFQQSFFGTNYPRLRSIKNKYDPRGVLVCLRCVGSEDWDAEQICPRRR